MSEAAVTDVFHPLDCITWHTSPHTINTDGYKMSGELEGKRLACNWITFGENYYNIRFNPLYCENWLLKAYPLPMWLVYVAVFYIMYRQIRQ